MANIHDAWMDNVSCDNNGYGAVLHVEFDNNISLSMSLDTFAEDPLFSEIILTTQKNRAQPRTDGISLHWSNGANLSIEDIVAMIRP